VLAALASGVRDADRTGAASSVWRNGVEAAGAFLIVDDSCA
jgi:hypothetical protein